MKSIKKVFIFIVIFALAYFAWNTYTAKDLVDIYPCKIKVFRIDSQLSKIDSSNVLSVLNEIKLLHADAFVYYLKNHLSMNFNEFDSKMVDEMLKYVSYSEVFDFQKRINTKFGNIKELISEFEIAFGRYSYFFKDSAVPQKILIVNSFNSYGIDRYSDNLIIGIDQYLGKDFPGDRYNYISKRSDLVYILPDALEYWMSSTFYKDDYNNFLDEMIYKGKIMYTISLLLPEYEDYKLLRFSQDDLLWCEEYEYEIWNEILEMDVLYDNNLKKVRSFFFDAPFTKGMPKESPARLAYWVGYRIIQSYVKNNDISMNDMLLDEDSQSILLNSKYLPNAKK
ncbi:MAG: hypothetical protein CMP51_03800 [Flavobacteriales bacterium]|nr:hypothetical protein [Flavobacteriales bacterium]|tara:strand:+ start:698 stop:1711 length:1014 start_codon:yes stop_codon:yes gene_type:complete